MPLLKCTNCYVEFVEELPKCPICEGDLKRVKFYTIMPTRGVVEITDWKHRNPKTHINMAFTVASEGWMK